MVLRIVVGLALTAVAFAVAGRRLWWLKRLALTGQPAPERIEAARNLVGRHARAEEIATAILFLLGPASSWINGTEIVADGGLTALREAAAA